MAGHDGIYCSRCRKLTTQKKALSFCRLPNNLVIHLKRFEQHRKLTNLVQFGQTLDMRPYLPAGATTGSDLSYQLYAVSNHMGSLNGGHYTAHCRNVGDGQWYCYNDERVSRVDASRVHSADAYVLYYERTLRKKH